MSTNQIGDNGFPNKFWVSWTNDYYIKKNNVYERGWASEIEGFKVTGGTSKSFKTYKEAKSFYEDLELTYPKITAKFIEDRITATVESEIMVKEINIISDFHDNLEYTIREMKKRGEKFE